MPKKLPDVIVPIVFDEDAVTTGQRLQEILANDLREKLDVPD
jgi:hypothetical protein